MGDSAGMTIAPEAFQSLLTSALGVSRLLHDEIARIGPLPAARCATEALADRLFRDVVGQQLSKKAATSIWGRIEVLAAARGGGIRDLLAPGMEDEVRRCGVSRNKVKAMQAILAAERGGLLGADVDPLPHAGRVARITAIWGLGRWTADMVGIFHYADPDVWPEGDVAAVGTLRLLSGRDDTTAVAAAFAPYRSILARYCWLIRDEVTVVSLAA